MAPVRRIRYSEGMARKTALLTGVLALCALLARPGAAAEDPDVSRAVEALGKVAAGQKRGDESLAPSKTTARPSVVAPEASPAPPAEVPTRRTGVFLGAAVALACLVFLGRRGLSRRSP